MTVDPPPSDDSTAPLRLSWREWLRDIRMALGFFTRLPVADSAFPAPSLAAAARAFPIAGAILGLILAGLYHIAILLGFNALLAAALVLAASALLTGALHEDGLADCCDALGARGNRDSKLAILRDSRIGSFGTLGLIFASLIKIAALSELARPGFAAGALIAAHALARAVLPMILYRLAPARSDGLGHGAGRPERADVSWSLGLGFAIAILAVTPIPALAAIAAALAAAFLVGALARRHLGGHTGDVLGAAEQMAEIAILVVLCAFV